MNIHVQLEPESEQLLRRRAQEAGVDVETYVRQAIRQRLNEPVVESDGREFVENLDESTASGP